MIAAGRAVVVGLATVLALGVAAPAFSADGEDLGPPNRVGGDVEVMVTVPQVRENTPDGPVELTNAELRWSVNHEVMSGSRAGGCNFLMAGRPGGDGDTGGSFIWGDADAGLYQAVDGDVQILRPEGDDERPVRYSERCLDLDGNPLRRSAENTSQSEVVMVGGTGLHDTDGSLDVSWSGTFSVVFYGGMTYWWASGLELNLDARGNGELTATVGGFGTDMLDTTRWVALRERKVALATFHSGRPVWNDFGVELEPDWCHVEVEVTAGSPQVRQDFGSACWGAFPAEFVDFQMLTGQSSYWYSSGIDDRFKVPTTVVVSLNADESLGSSRPPARPPRDGLGPNGPTPGFAPTPVLPGANLASNLGGSTNGEAIGAGDPTARSATGGPGGAGRLGGPGGQILGTGPVDVEPTVFFPATAAATLGARTAGLVPELPDDGLSPGDLLAYGIALLGSGTAATVVGFRRGWLVLPFTS